MISSGWHLLGRLDAVLGLDRATKAPFVYEEAS